MSDVELVLPLTFLYCAYTRPGFCSLGELYAHRTPLRMCECHACLSMTQELYCTGSHMQVAVRYLSVRDTSMLETKRRTVPYSWSTYPGLSSFLASLSLSLFSDFHL